MSDPEWITSQSETAGVLKDGWWTVTRPWKRGETIAVHLSMPIEREHADERVDADRGRVALMRGPMVYCLEGVDNAGAARSIALPPGRRVRAEPKTEELGGIIPLTAKTIAARRYPDGQRGETPADLRAVPYCVWDNRAAGDMVVWIPENPELAEISGERGSVEQNGVRLSASHCYKHDTLLALNDARIPQSSSDESIPRLTFWDHRGTNEWLEMEFEKPRTVHGVRVYWFDDTGRGSCRVPAAWSVSRRDGAQWQPVSLAPNSKYETAQDGWNAVVFEPLETTALRIDVELQHEFSSGVLEWQIE